MKLLAAGLFGLILASYSVAQSHTIAVIVNPKNPVTNLTLGDLRKIFTGVERTWHGGLPVKITVRGPDTLERFVLLRILGMSEAEYRQYWTAKVFRGEADGEPVVLPSFGMTKEAVGLFPGGIALVDVQDLKPGMNIKVIKVEGHMPGEPGYPNL
jgi:hypothetical protein